ncbi:MAG: HAD hydrolase-like protein [Patescibacteria group bacterium]
MTPKGIIYDLDGTLLDSLGGMHDRFFTAAQKINLPVDPIRRLQLHAYFVIARKNNTSEIARQLWPNVNMEALREAWISIDIESKIPLTIGAIDTLSELVAMGISQHLLTDRDPQTTHEILRRHYIDELFDSVHPRIERDCHKPDVRRAAPLMLCIEERYIRREELLYVGDAMHLDGTLARALDIPFVGITTGMHSRKEFLREGVKDDMIIDVLPELLKFFPE